MRVRFGSWSGTQDPLARPLSAEEVIEEVGDDLLAGMNPDQALDRLRQRGVAGRFSGLADLRERVEQARRRELDRMGLEGPLQQIAERLADIVERERTALEFAVDELAAEERRGRLDALPDDPAGQLAGLREYTWEDPRAGADYRALVEELRRDVAQATFGRLADALGSMTPEDLERTRDMLADLNALVAKRERGEDTSEDFAEFLERHGDLVPGEPATLDELLAELARRMAATSQMMAGLEPDQRAQLAELAESALGDLDLAFEANQLSQSLAGMFPELAWGQGVTGAQPTGAASGSLADTVDWIEHLRDYDDLAEALGQNYAGARLEDVDEELIRRLVGEEAAADVARLREIERALEEAGAARRQAGRLELTPRAIRRLGEAALARVFERTGVDAAGGHRRTAAGGAGEPTGTTRRLRFGDPFRLDIPRTLANAVTRTAGDRRAAGVAASARRVALAAEDFELAEAEQRVRATTVLLLDMSFSMPLRGNWVPAKKVALALQALIAGRFPEDRFRIIGFSDYARRLAQPDLLAAGWERVYGTNMEHAFALARRELAAAPGAQGHVIMITDGEPTAHLEGEEAVFAWPPEPETLRRTLASAARLARTGATMNVFLLDHDPGAARFVEQLVAGYGGRIFYPDLDDLGSVVVRDFLSTRRA